ncbi:hypothetical protein [Flagellimonas okinawensis]|uniref:Uncharacterized protein n=1 Tax=Flagellimonas okinawensis TaxID=3031324 RepID=A0ABT5XL09_9FLAO|nr:hypothetical protein [[Muricauda] okinawensis]MDF0706331.1 hypothetical protein [[Muricauda] okinawensis]
MRNNTLNAKRKGTNKLNTANPETKENGKNDITPENKSRKATNILIAKTALPHIEIDFFTFINPPFQP